MGYGFTLKDGIVLSWCASCELSLPCSMQVHKSCKLR